MSPPRTGPLTNLQVMGIAYTVGQAYPGMSLGDTYLESNPDNPDWYLVCINYHSSATGEVKTMKIDHYGEPYGNQKQPDA